MHRQRVAKHGDPLWTRRTECERLDAASTRDMANGCRLWTGYIGTHGYGVLHGRGARLAHRAALERALGRPLLAGMQALHTCDDRACVQTDGEGFYEVTGSLRPRRGHLWEGTTRDNTADRVAKSRSAFGERNGGFRHPEALSRGEHRYNAAFTADQVREIRRRVANGERQVDLADEYRVWRTTIHKIVHRESWKHV